jgi:hypothetical protein
VEEIHLRDCEIENCTTFGLRHPREKPALHRFECRP